MMRRAPLHFLFAAFLGLAALTPAAFAAARADVIVSKTGAHPVGGTASAMRAYGAAPAAGNMVDLYGTLTNAADAPDALTGVSSPAANTVRIVRWVRGVQITDILPLALPAATSVTFGPRAEFLRFYGARKTPSGAIPVTFHFLHAADVTVNVPVKSEPGP